MANDPRLLNSLRVRSPMCSLSVPLQLAAALGLALAAQPGAARLALYRSAFYLPSLLGGSVAISILWRQVFGTDGLVNQVLSCSTSRVRLGLQPDYALGTIIILNVWSSRADGDLPRRPCGRSRDVLRGGVDRRGGQAGPVPEYHAATAHPFVSSTWCSRSSTRSSRSSAFIVSGGTGGPVDSTMFYTLYLYQRGFGALEMATLRHAWLLLAIVAGLTTINFILSKYGLLQ